MVMFSRSCENGVMSEALEQFSVLGLPVHLLDDYSSWLVSRLHQNIGSHIVTLNSEMVMQSESNPTLANIIRKADLVIPDGAGVILSLRLHGKKWRRCPGIELAESLFQQIAQLYPGDREGSPNHSVFFYGGAPGIAQQAAAIWQQKLPDLNMAGTVHGYISPTEEQELLETLTILQPQLILVGLGVPRQEFWIAKHRHICPHAIWMGVGGSLDVWAGTKSRAPAWLRDNYLEWLYRLYQEPWRWRRMLVLPKFVFRILKEF